MSTVGPSRSYALVFVLAFLAACGFEPGGGAKGSSVDAGGGYDGHPDVVNVPPDSSVVGTIGLNGVCDPLADDQCQPGLTCRLRTATEGLCRPIPTGLGGASCITDDECGANMTCLEVSRAPAQCLTVCDVTMPSYRCRVGQACIPFWSDTVGFCR